MFTNDVVASVKIYRDGGGDLPRISSVRPAYGPNAAFWGKSPLGADSRLGWDVSLADTGRDGTGTVVTCGPAPQEGSNI
jgi:hypothetical protein